MKNGNRSRNKTTANEDATEDARWKYGVPPAWNANFACRAILNSTFELRTWRRLAPTRVAGFALINGSLPSNQSGGGEIIHSLFLEHPKR